MKIKLENVNLNSNSGPNSFAQKLMKYMSKDNHTFVNEGYDAALCFIETYNGIEDNKLFQRLDGIYFNSDFNYEAQNSNILRTYMRAKGVIFQSQFNKELTFKYFGEHKNYTIIHNGADTELIEGIEPSNNDTINKFDTVWSCAASWRPHKRLKDNVNYFLEHQGSNDCLVIAGKPDYYVKEPNIFYVGELDYNRLISLYKRSKFFLHLAWLDHCPNVVVDARASGCQIICSDAGGTKEIAGLDAIIIKEREWDFEPTKLYEPPIMDFSMKIKNKHNSCYDMKNVAKRYAEFMKT